MKIEIITTGDEVIQGVIVDTNSAWLAERCAKTGHEVCWHSSVGDDLKDIGDALLVAAKRADAVIVSGGLGPTADDITIEAAEGAFGVKFEVGKTLENKVGTAPGVQIKLGNAEFFFLPGVPKELYQIFADSIEPWLGKHSDKVAYERVLRCFGIPEASIDEKLKGVDLKGARLSFRVKFPEVLLKLIMRSQNAADAKSCVDAAAEEIRKRLGDVVYGEGEASLSKVVGGMLENKGLTIAIAESCTGGMVSNGITDVPGSSVYFERGIVCYSNKSKQELLGVPEEILKTHGAVSRETAKSMAEGVKKMSGASLGLSITGVAGPGGGTSAKPVGTVFIALATPAGTEVNEYHYSRDRLWFKQVVAATAIDLVRKYLSMLSS